MITIQIHEEFDKKDTMVYALHEIARQVEKGNTSGVNPTWEINGEEEDE